MIRNLYFALAKLPLKWLVRIKAIPEQPIESLELNLDKPIYYILRTRSTSSYTMLQSECKRLGLPEPQYLSSSDQEVKNGSVFFIQHKAIFGRRPTTISKYSKLLEKMLEQHKDNQDDVQLIPVSIYWGRNPGKEKSLLRVLFTDSESATPFRKLLILLFQGRNSFMQFGRPVQLEKLQASHSYGTAALKLIRILRVYFHRQWTAAMGPLVANRKQMITSLLANDDVLDAIKREQKKKKLTYSKARKQALKYADEIASNYSYKMVRFMSSFLSWLWNKMYGGIQVYHAERVRDIASSHEIIYVPCHRSHIDYLLLSYVLYYEGLVPPHIAAGINLNFWPIGGALRRGGAFFIRRSFSGNQLYTAVFNAYFHQLLNKGVPVEFFPEGGRSRTGRLLQPKTGMMGMMVQNFLRGCRKPIKIVPVYIGYERMMEGKSYLKEMQGGEKKKESMGQLLKVRNQLKQRYGKVYVNFAEPLDLEEWLQNSEYDWEAESGKERPSWLSDFATVLGEQSMTNINNSCVVNCVNLTSLILLSTQRNTLGVRELSEQLDLYLDYLNKNIYSPDTVCAYSSSEDILQEAKKLGAINEFQNPLGNLCQINERSAVLMTYYRNNIIHLFALPSLIASCFRQTPSYKRPELKAACTAIYPLLKRELFLTYNEKTLDGALEKTIDFLTEHQLIEAHGDDLICPPIESEKYSSLILLADILKDTLERYGITLTLLSTHAGGGSIRRAELEAQSQKLAQRIAALYSIYAPESFDKSLFQQIVGTLRRQGFIKNKDSGELEISANVPQLQQLVMSTLSRNTQEGLVKTARWAVKRWREES